MLHRARLSAVLFLLGVTLHISAQTLKPVPARVQHAREMGADFAYVRLFDNAPATDVPAARFAQGAQFLHLAENSLAGIIAARPKAISLALPFHRETLTVDLIQTDIQTADFLVSAGDEAVAVRPGLHYRGVLRGAAGNSIAAFSFFDNAVMGVVSDEQLGNLVLGKVQGNGGQYDYMFYAESELAMDNPFECNLLEGTPDRDGRALPATDRAENGRALRVYLEADHALYRERGNVQATADYLSAMFNIVSALYANEQIEMALCKIKIWVEPDVYADLGSSAAVLNGFRNQDAGTKADLSQLVALAGRRQESAAWLDALCLPEYAASFSNIYVSYSNVPTWSWTAAVMAHEMGHNFGARHTQWCGWPGGAIDPCQLAEQGCVPGDFTRIGTTVMSYCPLITSGINFSKGFGALPGKVLRGALNAAPCLTPVKTNVKTVENRNTTLMSLESMNLSPNPATKLVNVQLRYTPQSTVRVVLLDLVGRALHTQTAARGDATLQFDLSSLQKGVYLVQVFENEQLVSTKRLIKN